MFNLIIKEKRVEEKTPHNTCELHSLGVSTICRAGRIERMNDEWAEDEVLGN